MTGKEVRAAKAREALHDLDWKVLRHKEQLELVAAGKLDKTTLTADEYLALLEEKQRLRDSI